MSFLPLSAYFNINGKYRILRLYFSDLAGKIPAVNVKFPRLIPTFPHRNPVVFKLAVTVKSLSSFGSLREFS